MTQIQISDNLRIINNNKEKEFIVKSIDRLIHLRYDWKDEIPERIVTSLDEDNKFKVRTSWFSSLDLRFYGLKDKGVLDERLYNEQLVLRDSIRSKYGNMHITSGLEIKQGNNLLDEAIRNLQKVIFN